MRNKLLLAAALVLGGCGAFQNLLTINIGANVIPEFTVDEEFTLSDVDWTSCPEGEHTVADARTQGTLTFKVTAGASNCMLTFTEPDMLLFDEEQARQASDQLRGREIQGLEEASLIVKDFALSGDGAAFDVETRLDELEIKVDGQTLVNRAAILSLDNGAVPVVLNGALLDKLVNGVNTGTAVKADVDAVLVVPNSSLQNLPAVLGVFAVLQPAIKLNVVEAAGG